MTLRKIINLDCENMGQHITQEHVSIMNEGYAAPTKSENDITWLVFKDVDDHIDGNGYASLLLIEGEGIFYYKEENYPLKKGDVIIFSDKEEHGFTSDCMCQAINVVWEKEPLNEEVIELYKAMMNISKKDNKKQIKLK